LQYAGNVLVFNHGKQYHGDWFGGINTGNAATFLDALLACKVRVFWLFPVAVACKAEGCTM
jgi:hypothetical protein